MSGDCTVFLSQDDTASPTSHHAPRQRAGVCYFFEDRYYVFLSITVLYLAAMVAMVNRIRDANDTFRIKNEMAWICGSTAITTGARCSQRKLLAK